MAVLFYFSPYKNCRHYRIQELLFPSGKRTERALAFPALGELPTLATKVAVYFTCRPNEQVPEALVQILEGRSDANIRFDELCRLLLRLGFEERTRGSHHVFRKEGIEEKINLQRDDNKAKVYQVRQVRSLILKYKLGGHE